MINIIVITLLLFAIFLLILILSEFKNDKNSYSTKKKLTPKISIIVPFRNEAKNLDNFLDSCKNLSYSTNFEIIMINDDSTDDSIKIIENHLSYLTN
jgi:cellulose synthase/poly-beta-1,6-N-acetylglucosamine synthase-like glycosyltransferase